MNLVAVVNQRGQKQVQKFSVAPHQSAIVGRGWSSDIVIDDPYVDSAHARIYLDEQKRLCIEDLASQNGTRVNGKRLGNKIMLPTDATLKIGDTSIELVDTESRVPPPLKRSPGHKLLRKLNSFSGASFTTVAACLAMLLSLYFLTPQQATGENIASAYIGLGVSIFGWSLLAGILGKLFRGETNFVSHWAFLCGLFAIATLFSYGVDIVSFNLNSEHIGAIIETGVFIALIAIFAYVTFTLSTNLSAGKKAAISGVLASLPVAYMLISPLLQEEHHNWSGWVNVHQSSQPPALLFRAPTTLDAHLQVTATLFTELEEEVSNGSGSGEYGNTDKPLQVSDAE